MQEQLINQIYFDKENIYSQLLDKAKKSKTKDELLDLFSIFITEIKLYDEANLDTITKFYNSPSLYIKQIKILEEHLKRIHMIQENQTLYNHIKENSDSSLENSLPNNILK